MRKIIFILLCIGSTLTINGQVKIRQVQNVPYNSYNYNVRGSFYYKLPKIIPVLHIKVETTTYTPPFCDCLDSFKLNVDPGIKGIQPNKTKIKSVQLSTKSVADDNKIFLVTINPSAVKDLGWDFTMDRNNVINNAAVEADDKTMDIVVETLKDIAGIVGSVVAPKGLAGDSVKNSKKNPCGKFIGLYQRFDSEIHSLLTDGLTTVASRSTNTVDEIKYKINELEKMKLALFFRYVYKMEKEVTEYEIPLTIDSNTVFTDDVNYSISFGLDETNLLFDLDILDRNYEGVVDNNGPLRGYEYKIEFVKVAPYKAQKDVSSKLKLRYPELRSGLVYNVPQKMEVYISKLADGKEYLQNDTTIMLPQLGTLATLPRNLSKLKVEFNHETGELLKVSGTSKALLTSKNVGDLGEAFTKAYDKIIDKKETETKTEGDKTLEQEQKAIRALKKELGFQ
jgi:hypothetical protein